MLYSHTVRLRQGSRGAAKQAENGGTTTGSSSPYVRRARLGAGLSQEALAERAGLSQVYISQIESAKTAASVDTIERIAEGLGESAGRLLTAK